MFKTSITLSALDNKRFEFLLVLPVQDLDSYIEFLKIPLSSQWTKHQLHCGLLILNKRSEFLSTPPVQDLDSYIKTRSPVTFLSELRSHMQVSQEPGQRYNVSLMNALVLYVGMQAINYIQSKGSTPSMSTITHSSHMDIYQNLVVDLDTEGQCMGSCRVLNDQTEGTLGVVSPTPD